MANISDSGDRGTKLIRDVYPATRAGELAATQVLISFYGMIISYFTYQGLLKHLLDADPLSKKSLEVRKQHLRRMVEISLEALEKNGRKKG